MAIGVPCRPGLKAPDKGLKIWNRLAALTRSHAQPLTMSRTPLFRLLQRSYRAASYSVAHGEPVDELLDRGHEIRASRLATDAPMSRRQFVAGTAAVAAVATLDACAPRTPTTTATPQRSDGSAPVLI